MKRLRYREAGIDATDAAILRLLARDARASLADLARAVGMSAPSVGERVRRLEETGIIRGYAARIDPAALGLPLAAYIRVRPMPGQLGRTVEVLQGLEAVVACDRVTGEDCFIAKVQVRSVAELETVIDAIIPFAMTNSSLVQSSPIEPRLPRLLGPQVGYPPS